MDSLCLQFVLCYTHLQDVCASWNWRWFLLIWICIWSFEFEFKGKSYHYEQQCFSVHSGLKVKDTVTSHFHYTNICSFWTDKLKHVSCLSLISNRGRVWKWRSYYCSLFSHYVLYYTTEYKPFNLISVCSSDMWHHSVQGNQEHNVTVPLAHFCSDHSQSQSPVSHLSVVRDAPVTAPSSDVIVSWSTPVHHWRTVRNH